MFTICKILTIYCFRVWSFIGFELLLTFEKYNHFMSNFALSIIFARGDVTFFLAGLYPDHSDTAELFVQPVHSRWWLNGILVEYCSQNEAKLRIGGGETQESREYSVGDYAANAALRSAEKNGNEKGRAGRNCGWSIMSVSCKYSSDNRFLVWVVLNGQGKVLYRIRG